MSEQNRLDSLVGYIQASPGYSASDLANDCAKQWSWRWANDRKNRLTLYCSGIAVLGVVHRPDGLWARGYRSNGHPTLAGACRERWEHVQGDFALQHGWSLAEHMMPTPPDDPKHGP